MITRQRRIEESSGSRPAGGRHGAGLGTLLLATACGVGVGLLTAPRTGKKTRKLLRKRLAGLGGDAFDGWSGVSGIGSGAGRGVRRGLRRVREGTADAREALGERWEEARERWRSRRRRPEEAVDELEDEFEELTPEDQAEEIEEAEEESGSGVLATVAAIAAGAALAYALTADSAAPVRSRVQEIASDLGQRAVDRWRERGEAGTDDRPGAPSIYSTEAPQPT